MAPVRHSEVEPEESSGETILYRADALRHRGLAQTEDVVLMSAPRGVWTLFWLLVGSTLVFAAVALAVTRARGAGWLP